MVRCVPRHSRYTQRSPPLPRQDNSHLISHQGHTKQHAKPLHRLDTSYSLANNLNALSNKNNSSDSGLSNNRSNSLAGHNPVSKGKRKRSTMTHRLSGHGSWARLSDKEQADAYA